jgi:hypothetical protein
MRQRRILSCAQFPTRGFGIAEEVRVVTSVGLGRRSRQIGMEPSIRVPEKILWSPFQNSPERRVRARGLQGIRRSQRQYRPVPSPGDF